MPERVALKDLPAFALSPDSAPPVPAEPRRKRKLQRPTTPELEALYFRVNLLLTKRESAIFMWAMGRSEDKGAALASLFLAADSPQP